MPERMSPYTSGVRSEATRRLQQRLADRGFYLDAVDGIFGSRTAAAIAAARDTFGLSGEGVDRALLDRLAPTASDIATRLLLGRAVALIISQLKGRLPMSFLAGYRTYIVAGAMLLTGFAGMVGVDIPTFAGQAPGTLVMQALAFFFLRQGLKGAK